MLENANFWKRGLTAILMIMNGLYHIQNCTAKEIAQKYPPVIKHQKHPPNINNSGNVKEKLIRNGHHVLKNLEHAYIKLKNVIDRYDEKESELRVVFSGIANGELYKSKKRGDWLPKHRLLKDFNCRILKHPKNLKKQTYKLLWKFHSNVKSFDGYFQELINYEKLPRSQNEDRSNGRRLLILIELQTDLKMLDLEIVETITLRKNKRLNLYRQPKNFALTILQSPKSQTDLMIKEWNTIQHSKEFLKCWKKKLHKVCKCWKKRRN